MPAPTRRRQRPRKIKTLASYFEALAGGAEHRATKTDHSTRPRPSAMEKPIPDVVYIARTRVPPVITLSVVSQENIVAFCCPLQTIQEFAPKYRLNLPEFQTTERVAFLDHMIEEDALHAACGHDVYWIAVASIGAKDRLSFFANTRYIMTIIEREEVRAVRISHLDLHENNQCGWASMHLLPE